MTPIRVGLLGCGRIARLVHLRLLSSLSGARLVAFAEPDERLRSEASRMAPGAAAAATFEEVVARPDVDAVVICLPNNLHASAALAALAVGKHVYLEKPLAVDTAEGARVVSLWRDRGLVGMIGFNYRFHPLHRAAQAAIGAGRIGTPVTVRSVFSSPARALPPWQQARAHGGGVLLNLGSHHFDLVPFLLQAPVGAVFAQLRSQRSEHDTAVVHLQVTDGTQVQSFFSMNAAQEDRLEIYGDAGKVVIDRLRNTGTVQELSGPGGGKRPKPLSPGVPWPFRRGGEPSYRAALEAFVGAVGANTPASPDLADGFRSLALVEAAERSAASAVVVTLPQTL